MQGVNIVEQIVEQSQQGSFEDEKRKRLNEKLIRELGPTVMAALSDEAVVEIMLNQDGQLWEDRHNSGMKPVGQMDRNRAISLIGTIAGMLNLEASVNAPVIEGELPLDGSRFEGLLPPVVQSPVFAIRKKAHFVYTLDDYVKDGIMAPEHRASIISHVKQKSNFLIVGGTGTGKTTLANAILSAVSTYSPNDRIVMLEDTLELQCSSPNVVSLRTSSAKNMNDLLRATMRLRPDRICVGEVRDKAAHDLLKAWNTGHPGGLATIHANSAEMALTRLSQLVEEAGVPAIPAVVASAVNVVISIQRTSTGRKIKQMIEVIGVDPDTGEYMFKPVRVAE
ncbi:P-type conjugative transfer ATPase TrbB [Limnobacter sp. MED105]|uniref:P-type conjugative transfer ATPase TrbB n=1 Tax=Limnobacter sp. MED105 TaxID=391597 RepID=UPI000156C595|nr:P-type conjugative transfer ATPase TrbB [Limnobacter sp. MED105]EDM82102.1 probable conjugal transfer protein TrbB [Limnobacter sp. MED105]